MAPLDYNRAFVPVQGVLAELAGVFGSIDDDALLARLQEYRWTGRQGYSLRALWRAYLGSFILNLPHTNALIRRLEDDADFRRLCGFRTGSPTARLSTGSSSGYPTMPIWWKLVLPR